MTDEEVQEVLREAGLITGNETACLEPLTGGVSSMILKASLPNGRAVCVKSALARLKVAERWEADPGRNRSERESIRIYDQVVPGSVPRILHENHEEQLFVMEFLERARTWKSDLLAGVIDPATADRIGMILGSVHRETSGQSGLVGRFDHWHLFEQLRIDPYLRTVAVRHPDLRSAIDGEIQSLQRNAVCLIHGDVSPKNIMLVAPSRVVLLDHEVALFGDPAFDLAFLLNHLLLKAVRAPGQTGSLVECANRFLSTYGRETKGAAFPNPDQRTGRLLPMLMLARIDGKSPVDYLTEAQREATRLFARSQITRPPSTTEDFIRRFITAFNS